MEKFEELIKKVILEDDEAVHIPDADQIWEKIKERLKIEEHKNIKT